MFCLPSAGSRTHLFDRIFTKHGAHLLEHECSVSRNDEQIRRLLYSYVPTFFKLNILSLSGKNQTSSSQDLHDTEIKPTPSRHTTLRSEHENCAPQGFVKQIIWSQEGSRAMQFCMCTVRQNRHNHGGRVADFTLAREGERDLHRRAIVQRLPKECFTGCVNME